ncbi:hypothetical protein [Kineosporia babensis]|nr:hypothetical protein [Kineosporia babensis]
MTRATSRHRFAKDEIVPEQWDSSTEFVGTESDYEGNGTSVRP